MRSYKIFIKTRIRSGLLQGMENKEEANPVNSYYDPEFSGYKNL